MTSPPSATPPDECRDPQKQSPAEAALALADARARAILETAIEGIITIDADGVIIDFNPAAQAIFGYRAAEIIGRNVNLLVPEMHRGRHDGYIDRYLETGEQRFLGVIREVEGRRKDGQVFPMEISVGEVRAGTMHSFTAIVRDISERREAEEALRQSEERFRSIFEHASVGMALVAPDGRWLQVNRALTGIVGYAEADLLSMHFQQIIHPDDLDTAQQYAQDLLAGRIPWYHTEMRCVDSEGNTVWVLLSVSLVRGAAGEPAYFVAQLQDVTARKEAETELRAANARLERLATRDGLTGLKNYRAFQQRLAAECSRVARLGVPLTLLLLDVDNFKAYNDSFGHLQGDEALRQVGAVLEHVARDIDIVARYGGEEFAAILPHTDAAGALVAAERFRHAVEASSWKGRGVTISVGGASCDGKRPDPSALIAEADAALYRAKREGRNRVCWASG